MNVQRMRNEAKRVYGFSNGDVSNTTSAFILWCKRNDISKHDKRKRSELLQIMTINRGVRENILSSSIFLWVAIGYLFKHNVNKNRLGDARNTIVEKRLCKIGLTLV